MLHFIYSLSTSTYLQLSSFSSPSQTWKNRKTKQQNTKFCPQRPSDACRATSKKAECDAAIGDEVWVRCKRVETGRCTDLSPCLVLEDFGVKTAFEEEEEENFFRLSQPTKSDHLCQSCHHERLVGTWPTGSWSVVSHSSLL